MKITILDHLRTEHSLKAWRLSRDLKARYNMGEVLSVDASVNEMPSALLHFEGFTIIEREIFTTPRNHVIWARTSRVDDPLEFTVPISLHADQHQAYREYMQAEQARGVAQDQWRMALPLVACTSWVARISMRDLGKMKLYFEELAAINGPLGTRFNAVAQELANVLAVMGALPPQGRAPRYLNENTIYAYEMLNGPIQVVTITVPVAMRAQLVRHRELLFVDDFLHLLLRDDVLALQLSATITMQIAARADVWRAVLSHRACWIAQNDLWQPLIKRFGGAMLPCADGVCPFEADAKARLTPGNDPNPPCPRYMNLHNLSKAEWKERMMTEAYKRGGIWPQEVLR